MGPFEIHASAGAGMVRLQVEGDVDTSTAPQLLDAILAAAITNGPGHVVVDLRDLAFIDSTGIHALAVAHRRLIEDGSHLIVCDPPRLVQRILEITGVDDLLDVRPHWAAAALFPPAETA